MILFHQVDAPSHTFLVPMAAVRDGGSELVDHHPYSLNLSQYRYDLFPNMKKHLFENKYLNYDGVKSTFDHFEQKDESFYTNGIQVSSSATPKQKVCGMQEGQ